AILPRQTCSSPKAGWAERAPSCHRPGVTAYDAPVQELEHAARALGWDGHLVADLEVFGARFAAVARIRPDVHRWRHAHGWGPELDPSSFRSSSESDRI